MSRCWLATALVQECGKGGVGPVFFLAIVIFLQNTSRETKHTILIKTISKQPINSTIFNYSF